MPASSLVATAQIICSIEYSSGTRLSQRFESAFDGMSLEHGPNRTVLHGDIRDQAQLYGLLGRLQEFGIELLAVEPANGSDAGSEPGPGPGGHRLTSSWMAGRRRLDRFYGLAQSPARPRMGEGGPAGQASVRVS
jgi:hypothetical protein